MSIQTEIDRIITAVGNAYDAIGAKGGTVPTDETVANLAGAINTIPAGAAEPVLQEKSVTPSTSPQTVTPDAGYDGLSKVDVAAMPAAEQATPSITVSASGLITAQATQSAGYVSAGSKSATKQLATQAAKTITPGTSDQTAVSSGKYTTGDITVKGDTNLVAGNIKQGISIFGVDGAYEGSSGSVGGGGSVETCTLNITIQENYVICATFYENGEINSIKLSSYGSTNIENVVCNSCFYLFTKAKPIDETYSDTVSLLHSYTVCKVFRISGDGSIYWD